MNSYDFNFTWHLLIYISSFVSIWFGSGIVVTSVERLARRIKLSSFLVSFFVLGFFTSISELSVGVNAVIQQNPEIYVGNLLGASLVLMLLILPLLTLVDGKIQVTPEFQKQNLTLSLFVVVLPAFLASDGKITYWDALAGISAYIMLILNIQRHKSVFSKIKAAEKNGRKFVADLFKILIGISIIFITSRFVVDQTMFFAEKMSVSPYIVSLLVVAIGTNLPELALIFRSIFMKSEQIAFGDLLGSAAFNTFLIGFLTIVNGAQVQLTNSYFSSLIFLPVGSLFFYIFARTKHRVSRWEGLFLVLLYILFLIFEVGTHWHTST